MASLLFVGCGAGAEFTASEQRSEIQGDEDTPPLYLDQGWTTEMRGRFYQTTQGSRMLPYDWFLHLEAADSRQKFRAPSRMRTMGFLVDEASPHNPDRLPVGFAKDEDPLEGASIGLTCAGCHTGEIEYAGTRIRIDGGQAMIDLEAFQDALLASLQATIADPAKRSRFETAILGAAPSAQARAALAAKLQQYANWWSARITRSRGLSPHGPSRTDAFTIIGNEVVCVMLGVPANCAPAVAPTQYPFLWNTPDFDWVQYNSSVHSPLGRNVGEVTGVFAEASLAADGSVVSSANIENLYRLETWLEQLRAPTWPEEILGPIDTTLATQGAALFGAQCASCHTEDPQPRTAPNAFGVTFAQVNFQTPLSALRTDPTAAMSFATRRADPGPWTPLAQALGLLGPDGKTSVAALLSVSGTSIIRRYFAINQFPPLEQARYNGFRESLTPSVAQLTTYKARPLNGVAFTAPFLHNGSVPSIYELLLPASERPSSFHVGSLKFDPVKLGYSTQREAHTVPFDTTQLGNSNAGHEYGTGLTHEERMAIIEYLKTL